MDFVTSSCWLPISMRDPLRRNGRETKQRYKYTRMARNFSWTKKCPWQRPIDPKSRGFGELETVCCKVPGHHPSTLLTFTIQKPVYTSRVPPPDPGRDTSMAPTLNKFEARSHHYFVLPLLLHNQSIPSISHPNLRYWVLSATGAWGGEGGGSAGRPAPSSSGGAVRVTDTIKLW